MFCYACADELERLEKALDLVKKQLFGRLHDIARQQIFPGGAPGASSSEGSSESSSSSSSEQSAAMPVAAEVMATSNGDRGRLLPQSTGHVIDAEAVTRQ